MTRAACNVETSSSNNKENVSTPLRARWTIDDFERGRLLGSGRFGNVFLCRERRSGQQVALKVRFAAGRCYCTARIFCRYYCTDPQLRAHYQRSRSLGEMRDMELTQLNSVDGRRTVFPIVQKSVTGTTTLQLMLMRRIWVKTRGR
jgi:hypothetical protein